MELGSALVGIVILLICIVPILVLSKNKKQKENKMLASLNEFAQQNDCRIDLHEFCLNCVIGIDKSKNYVFFLKSIKEHQSIQYVDLSKAKECQIIKRKRHINNGNESTLIIEGLDLSFYNIDKTLNPVNFEIYNEKTNFQISSELQFADKWAKLIKERILSSK
ncbi:MAG TPA: hypothetical protein PKD85_18880 [Saprospiraceae bacterium]|nr:hypothetical protein [Saprospiraceae bacterium]